MCSFYKRCSFSEKHSIVFMFQSLNAAFQIRPMIFASILVLHKVMKVFMFLDCYQENGKNYRGAVRKTRKGVTCQRWNVNTPHRTKYDLQTHFH